MSNTNTENIYDGKTFGGGEKAMQNEKMPVDGEKSTQNTPQIDADNCALANNQLLDAFNHLGVFVVDKATRKVLYFNRRLKEICPHAYVGIACDKLIAVDCYNCPIEALSNGNNFRAVVYSDTIAGTLEMTATNLTWNKTTPAVLVSVWQQDFLSTADGVGEIHGTDMVTGGLTRASFIHAIEQLRTFGTDLTQYAVLFVNLQKFKAINETVGCDGGDSLLRTVYQHVYASELKPVVGARKESDHFLFLVEKRNLNLSKLPQLLSLSWKYNGKSTNVHCRCGVYMIDFANTEVFKMIDRAQLAKDYIVDEYLQPYAVFEHSMLKEYVEEAEALQLVDTILNNNEFVVYYQPVVDAKTEKIVGAEALIRRITPNGNVVSPGEFIPVLERTGFISKLDQFVVEHVGTFLLGRHKQNKRFLPVSVNLSQKDTCDVAFMEWLAGCMEQTVLPHGHIMLEITEGVYAVDEQMQCKYLNRLHKAGAKILLDDFGTGYSSFAMFEHYTFDRVKLDMQFVHKMEKNENVRKVVKCIVSMCHSLGVKVVAEGVETAEQLRLVRKLGCDFIQGYYFSKPLDEKTYEKLVDDNQEPWKQRK